MFVSCNRQFSYNFSMKNRVKEIRKMKGLSQTELADACGTSLRNIQYIESGERGLEEWFEKISQALDVPGWQLIAHPNEVYPDDDRQVVSAYRSLNDDDKRVVDKFLFLRRGADTPLTSVPPIKKDERKDELKRT